MKTKQIKTKAGKHIKKIKKLNKEALTQFDKEVIHKWRLEIKKLKALMRLLSKTARFNYKKNFSRISPIYQLLGSIREVQLQLEKPQGIHKGFWTKYTRLLKEELKECKDAALHKYDEQALEAFDKIMKNMVNALERTNKKELKTYFEKQVVSLRKRIDKLSFEAEELHDLRKLIKEFIYNSVWDEKKAAKALKKYNITSSLLEEAQKWLGEWHDIDILTQQLQQRQTALLLKNGENEAFLDFKSSLEVEKSLLKNKLEEIFGRQV